MEKLSPDVDELIWRNFQLMSMSSYEESHIIKKIKNRY